MKLRFFLFTLLFMSLMVWLSHSGQPGTLAQNLPDRADFSCSSVSEIPYSECRALVDLFNDTSGPNWFNNDGWLQTNTPCSWYGINCQMLLGEVNIIFLSGNNLQGTIPASLGRLNLRWLDLSHNLLTGTIPKEIAGASFAQLLLNNNQLRGELPTEFGQSTSTRSLDLSHNLLEGELPDSLGQMTTLYNLHLNHNNFYGPLPLSLTNLRDLEFFSFDETRLCEPQDGGFQFWLLNIDRLFSTGSTCAARRPWTLMYYYAVDEDLTTQMEYEMPFLEKASANRNAHIVYFTDKEDKHREEYGSFQPGARKEIDEPNTGDPQTLREFIQWAQENYPAENYALILVDHSYGVTGFGKDGTGGDSEKECDGLSCLTFKELREALLPIPKLDIVYIAACASATIEVGYQLRDQTDYLVASEQIAWAPRDHSRYIIGTDGIGETTSSEVLAKNMARGYFEDYNLPADYDCLNNPLTPFDECQWPMTSSVVRVYEVQNVVDKADRLGMLLDINMQEVAGTLKEIRQDVQHFSTASDMNMGATDRFNLVDLYDVALKVEERIDDPQTQQSAVELKAALDHYIVDHYFQSGSFYSLVKYWQACNGGLCIWDLEDSHGVSVYWPDTDVCPSFYSEKWLDFAHGSDCNNWAALDSSGEVEAAGWASMLVSYIYTDNPDAPIDPDPPPLIAPLSTLNLSYIPVTTTPYP